MLLVGCGTEPNDLASLDAQAPGLALDVDATEGGQREGEASSRDATSGADITAPSDDASPSLEDSADEGQGHDTHEGADGQEGPEGDAERARADVPLNRDEDDALSSGALACTSDADCPVDACLSGECIEGFCVPAPDESPCDDENPCTGPDLCSEGQCQAGPPQCDESCDNGLDDDLDGLVDCLDDECLVSATCGELCQGQEVLTCGQQIFDTRDKLSATTLLGDGCAYDGGGKEVIYRFAPPPDLLNFEVSLDGDAHVALYAAGALGVCEGAACKDADPSGWLWLQDDTSEEFYIVVDGPAGWEGAFSLELTCSFPLFESCSNGVDDDLNGGRIATTAPALTTPCVALR